MQPLDRSDKLVAGQNRTDPGGGACINQIALAKVVVPGQVRRSRARSKPSPTNAHLAAVVHQPRVRCAALGSGRISFRRGMVPMIADCSKALPRSHGRDFSATEFADLDASCPFPPHSQIRRRARDRLRLREPAPRATTSSTSIMIVRRLGRIWYRRSAQYNGAAGLVKYQGAPRSHSNPIYFECSA